MQNDAKLGFLVGVGGVVAAAVLFFQNQPSAGPPAEPERAVTAVAAPALPPVPAATPAAPVKPTAVAKSPAPRLPAGREELQGRPTSRPAADDE